KTPPNPSKSSARGIGLSSSTPECSKKAVACSSKRLGSRPAVGWERFKSAGRSLRLIAAITAASARSGARASPRTTSHHADCGYIRSVTCRLAVVRMARPSAEKTIRKYADRLLFAVATPHPRLSKLTTAMNQHAALNPPAIDRGLVSNVVLIRHQPPRGLSPVCPCDPRGWTMRNSDHECQKSPCAQFL